MVELAWLWLKNQPTSALSLWFHERVRRLGGRMRKTTIVALARKLLIAEGSARRQSDPIRKDLISPAGSRWPNRNGRWPQQPVQRMVPAS